MIKVAVNMSADLFHEGHAKFLASVKSRFKDEQISLTVLLSTDEQILQYKKRRPIQPFESRKTVLLSCRFVDSVIPHPDKITMDLVNQYDYLFHGDDLLQWDKIHLEKGMNLFINAGKLILIPYTPGVSTTQLINQIIRLEHDLSNQG